MGKNKMNECAGTCEDFDERLRQVEHNDVRFAEALEGIKKNTDELLSVARQQVRLEERQISQGQAIDRAFAAIEKLSAASDARLRLLESNAPTNNLATKWIFAGVAAAISTAFTWLGRHL